MNQEQQTATFEMEERSMFDFSTHWPAVMELIRQPEMQEKLGIALEYISIETGIPEFREDRRYPVCLFFEAIDPEMNRKLTYILSKVGFSLLQQENSVIDTEAICAYFQQTYDNPYWWMFPSKHWLAFLRELAFRLVPGIDWRLHQMFYKTITITDPHNCYIFDLYEWLRLKDSMEPAILTPGLAFDLFTQEKQSFSFRNYSEHKVYDEATFFSPVNIFQQRFAPSFQDKLQKATTNLSTIEFAIYSESI